MSTHPPVQDWTTDFDHTDPAWVRDPYPNRKRCDSEISIA